VRLKALKNQASRQKPTAALDARMGETLQSVSPRFNRSLRIEMRADRLTGDPGAILLREVLEGGGIVDWMTAQTVDPRREADVTHDLASLIRSGVPPGLPPVPQPG